ncbi:DUF4262 domain-containing protein [Novosphingobium sp. FGD1]|jgi:hypothetical protein|uniref:DUF4262 domain-containing protein n=1 Tax=Novosphingobium silvae TaxID=2692619 RepID=A0A7X4GHJ1_9SPHN|nr:DUF4262 domain-containing protein [Novosphingobium silvae]MYL97694.1 DUF4262 domain-containing protein [Novosphingobium silvae]
MTEADWDVSGYEQQILDNVEEFGCHITVVSPPGEDGDDDDFDDDDLDDHDGFGADFEDEEEPSKERFAYSVGFTRTVKQPELIVFGFSTELSAAVINGVLDMCREGLVLEDWKEIDGLLKGHRCVLREVERDCIVPYYFNSAMWFAEEEMGHELTRAMQLVWPGVEDGLFPWDKGCSEMVRDLQTPLYRTSLNS